MNEKRLIDLALSNCAQQPSKAYFGATLTSILGDSNPAKSLIRSLECTRLVPTCSRRQGKIASAQSKTTTSNSSHRSLTDPPSRAVSADSRGISAVSSSLVSISDPLSRAVSADSRGILAVSSSTVSISDPLSRAVSADSRGISAVSSSTVSISDRASSKGNNLLAAPVHKTTDLCTYSRWCRSGLTVCTLQNEVLQELGINEHGCFHQANCYMVFQSDHENGIGTTFLYVWSGSRSCKADYDILITYAEEFDKYFGGVSFMSLEYEGHETISFLRHFQDGIIVDDGKSRQNSRKAIKCAKRLYKVVGRSYPSAKCIESSDKSATENDILILDGYPRMYVWVGQQTDFVHRVKAIRLAKKIRSRQRDVKCHIIVVEQKGKQMSDAFLKKLGSVELCQPNTEETTVTEVTNYKPRLYKVNGPRILYDMPLVAAQPLKQRYLTSQDTFLLDVGPSCPLYIWIGNSANADAIYDALQCAMNFKQNYNYPTYTAVCRVREGIEPVDFIKAFIDWTSRLKKHGSAVNNYPMTNIDRSSHIIDDSSPGDLFQSGNGKTEMWQVNGETLDNVPIRQHGVFHNHRCYIVFNRKSIPEVQLVIYLWVGSKTSIKDQHQAMKMALTMNSLKEHKATIIRVFGGREQHHFIQTMQGAIIVYDVCLVQDSNVANNSSIDSNTELFNNTNNSSIESNTEVFNSTNNSSTDCNTEFFNRTLMFRVEQLEPDCVRMSQVPPVSTSLNSATVYVIITRQTSTLWYGKKLPRHVPTLVLCSRKLAMLSFTDIPDFSQEDLCETDIFILDTHDQIQLWIGSCAVGGDDQETLSNVIQAYIDLDPAGRKDSDLQLLFCHQGYEPSLFRKYFRRWNCHEYGGEMVYEQARRQLRLQNADININCQGMPDENFKRKHARGR